tara:strand:+ start:642 stop:869 length:228 start_codon:yes stop_codon:yes gene_type:complete
MIDSVLIFFSIIFLGIVVYAFQMRNRLHKKYSQSCDVVYLPKKEKIIKDNINISDIKFIPDSSYRLYDPSRISGF